MKNFCEIKYVKFCRFAVLDLSYKITINMELPFYLSFSDFENNYYNHLEQWFEKHCNTSEIDFLKAYSELYLPYVSYNFSENKLQTEATINVKNNFFPFIDNYGISLSSDGVLDAQSSKFHQISEWKSISMIEYAQCVLDKINKFLQQKAVTIKENESILNYLNNYEIITQTEIIGYNLDFRTHQKTLPFLRAYLPILQNNVDVSSYRNFYFSVVKIANFLDGKLNSVQAYDESIYSQLKTKSLRKRHLKNQTFLTICN